MATARKSTASRPKPEFSGKVHFNLDTFESERAEVEEFAFVLGGRRITMRNPRDVDWQDLAELDDPFTLAEVCMEEGDREFFLDFRMPAKKLEGLVQAFQKHYGLGSRGNARA